MIRTRFYLILVSAALVGEAGLSWGEDAPVGPRMSTPTISAIPLEDVPMQADSAYSSLNAIDADLSSDRATGPIRKELPLLSREINTRSEETSKLLSASPSLDRLERLEAGWRAFEHDFDQGQRDITRRADQLEKYTGTVHQMSETWTETLKDAQNPNTPAPVLESIQRVVGAIDQTHVELEKKRRENLLLQGGVTREDARVDREIDTVNRAYKEARDHIFSRGSLPIWKAAGQAPSAPALAEEGRHSLGAQLAGLRAYADRQAHQFFIHAFILLFLVFSLYWMRARFKPIAASAPPGLPSALKVLEVPFAVAVILWLLASLGIYHQAPRLLWAIWGAAALIPTIVIVRRLISVPVYPILNALVFFYGLDQLREVVAVLPLVSRLLFLAEMAVGFLLMAWFLVRLRHEGASRDKLSRLLVLSGEAALALFVVAFLSDLFGYVNLSTLIGNAVLKSADLAVIFYALVRLLDALLAFVFNVGPISTVTVIQKHQVILRDRTEWILSAAAWVFWGFYVLGLLTLRGPLFAVIGNVLDYSMTLGSFSITSGHIVSFGLTLWIAMTVSRFIRFILEEDIYPRFQLHAGLPYAISTLLNYVILTVGFFLAVAALGFDMTKFTILAGAFGVGVGFGTQNIINNFVSGLILLFERPIKVGDVIQVDDATGAVQRIGIRATVIRTTSGSEVVVPNAALISGRVTNWTSISGQRSIEMPVSVASGSEPRHVMDLLKSVAAADERIAKDPAPQAFFVKYSPGSLDFELRVWTDHVNHTVQIRSDLALALNAALFKEDLAIK